MKQDTEEMFFGKIAWGACSDWARDIPTAGAEWFRLWEELSGEEQERYIIIGSAIATYVRNFEGSEVLKLQTAAIEKKFEEFRTLVQKDNKDRGGR